MKRLNDPSCDSLKWYMNLIVHPLPKLTVIPSKTNPVDYGDIITLTGSGAKSYIWNHRESFTKSIQYEARKNKTYYLRGVTEDGCIDSLEYKVILKDSLVGIASIPQAFTPNGDGINECFTHSTIQFRKAY